MEITSYEGKLRTSAENSLEKVVAQKVAKELRVHPMVVYGYPVDEIVRIATEKHADIIVVATHGRKGWKHLIFGSVAEKVV